MSHDTLPDYRTEREPQRPQRCVTLTVKIGGDTWEDTIRSLREAVDHIESHGPDCKMNSGGVSSGYYVEIQHRPEMTSTKYFEDLEAWQDHVRHCQTVPQTTHLGAGM